MTSYQYEDGSELYLSLISSLLTSGRGELRDVCITITDPAKVHTLRSGNRVNLKVAATQAMHLIGGISFLEQLSTVSSGRFAQLADDGRLYGAYGPRSHVQLLIAERMLKKNSGTRDAVVSIWTGNETARGAQDFPPAAFFQFFIRDEQLEIDVTEKSSELLTDYPVSIMVFSALQRAMAWALGIEPGWYRHRIGTVYINQVDIDRLGQVWDAGLIPGEPDITQIPLSLPQVPAWNRGFSFQAGTARRICLRDGTFQITDDPELEWLEQHVPSLGPGWDFCPLCRYVVQRDKGCDECGQALGKPSSPGKITPKKSISVDDLRPYLGRFVAVKDGKVVADASDITGIITILRDRKIVAESVFRVPRDELFTNDRLPGMIGIGKGIEGRESSDDIPATSTTRIQMPLLRPDVISPQGS